MSNHSSNHYDIRDANGWHVNERVHIQARDGNLMLVQYIHRYRVAGRTLTENGVSIRRKPIQPWAWVPIEDVIWDWEVRKLA